MYYNVIIRRLVYYTINFKCHSGRGAARLACMNGVHEVASSNLAAPTLSVPINSD